MEAPLEKALARKGGGDGLPGGGCEGGNQCLLAEHERAGYLRA